MLLTGTYSRAIDDKLRIAFPKPFRDRLSHSPGGPLYVAPGTDGSLAVYSEETFAQLAERLAQASPTAADVRAFGRLFFAAAQALELDSQGRIRLPAELAEWAGLGKEVMLLGVQDHVELWDRARWQNYLAEKQARYDEIAERAFQPPGN
ncbi:MAG TPA: division/cell wall cluster transcriptional repressor MraZ [Pirellulales bacterium]|nr:division/cell wall cluster transcriptional repressor MraZ [Pirellulales bacterium]